MAPRLTKANCNQRRGPFWGAGGLAPASSSARLASLPSPFLPIRSGAMDLLLPSRLNLVPL
jgi:hypothetical protein